MTLSHTEKDLELIYTYSNRLSIIEDLLPLLDQSIVQAIEILRYCRFQLLQAGMSDHQIPVYDIANELSIAGIPTLTSEIIETAMLPYIDNLEYINSEYMENLEMTIIGNEIIKQQKEEHQ